MYLALAANLVRGGKVLGVTLEEPMAHLAPLLCPFGAITLWRRRKTVPHSASNKANHNQLLAREIYAQSCSSLFGCAVHDVCVTGTIGGQEIV